MWWDWSQITLGDSLLFSILSILTLYLVGSGIQRLISFLSKKPDAFVSFDFFQKLNLRIVLGFTFIVLFILLFSLFGTPIWISGLLILVAAGFGFVAVRPELKLPENFSIKNNALIILLFAVLLVVIFFSSVLITGFFGSTNDDGAFHSFVIRIILDNPIALWTRNTQPYAAFTLTYPSGTHELGAFFVSLFGVSIQKIVIMLSVILPALIALSFYSTIKCLFESRSLSVLGLIIAAFFTIASSWVPVSWGGLPVLFSIYLSISIMGFIFVLLKGKMTWLNALFMGFFFFIASQTYPTSLLIALVWTLLVSGIMLLPKFRGGLNWRISFSSSINKKNVALAIAFLVPLIFSALFFFSIYSDKILGRQFAVLDPGSAALAEVVKERIDFVWLLDLHSLSVFFSEFGWVLFLAPFSLILLIVLFIPQISKRIGPFLPSKQFRSSLFLVYFLVLLLFSYLTLTLYLPINLLTTVLDPTRVWQHFFIPGVILTATVVFSVFSILRFGFKRLFFNVKRLNHMKLRTNRVFGCVLLGLLVLSVGSVLIDLFYDAQWQYNQAIDSVNKFETLGQSDISMMRWIIDNVPSNSSILISSGDSGQFVAAVTGRSTISIYSYIVEYPDLMVLLTSNASDLRAVPLMVEYDVSYVYIGSIASTFDTEDVYYRNFNASQFLSTPYFRLAQQVGDAWLFQFNATDGLNAYQTFI